MTLSRVLLGVLGIACLSASKALADPKVDATDIGLNGNAVGCAISPHCLHVAVLAQQGSRYAVYMDGVAGPKIEKLLYGGGTAFNATGNWVGKIPVLFSDDGAHWAYCYKAGADTVIILDGKEVARGPMQPALLMPLTFSAGGKHFAWGYDNRIFMDGQAGPQSRYAPQVFFSPDGSRYAYIGTEVGGNAEWGFVDGSQVSYFGEINQFAPNNHLISIDPDPAGSGSILVLDDKPEFKAAAIGRIWTSLDGKQIAVQLTPAPNSQQELTVNGNVVPGTLGVGVIKVYFSPDGKRYAVNCTAAGTNFMIIDGKRGDDYSSIPDGVTPGNTQQMQWVHPAAIGPLPMQTTPAFTADSSKFVYSANAAGQVFLVTEDGEYDDFTGSFNLGLALSPAGGHYGFIGQSKNRKQAVVIDGKAQILGVPGYQAPSCLSFSPDGSHYAFLYGYTLYVDGKPMAGGIQGPNYIFSPDGNHIAYHSYQTRLAMDGKIIQTDDIARGAICPIFSPDSRHFYWITDPNRIPNTSDTAQLFLDGKAVAHFSDIYNLGQEGGFAYDISPEGVLTFISRTDGELTRYVVTPDSNIDAMLSAAKPAPAAN